MTMVITETTIIFISITTVVCAVLFEYLISQMKRMLAKNGEEHIVNQMSRIFRLIFYSVIAIMDLGLLGINLIGILSAAGFLGIIIGLAVQQPLSNFFSGIYMVMTRMISHGEYISINAVGSNIHTTGNVIHIGFSHTTIKSQEDEDIRYIPNNLFITSILVKHQKIEKQVEMNV